MFNPIIFKQTSFKTNLYTYRKVVTPIIIEDYYEPFNSYLYMGKDYNRDLITCCLNIKAILTETLKGYFRE